MPLWPKTVLLGFTCDSQVSLYIKVYPSVLNSAMGCSYVITTIIIYVVKIMFIHAFGIILLYWVPVLLEKANHMQPPSYQSKWFGVHLKITTDTGNNSRLGR